MTLDRETLTKVVIPFIIFTAIWGSTWIVIRDQLHEVPAQWSVAYRFMIATVGMALVTRWHGHSLRPGPGFLPVAAVVGISQFVINFNGVYLAERYITSGLVATVFALLMVPNALLAWAWLGHKPTGRFLAASLVAIGGIALLFLHELRQNPTVDMSILWLGIGWTVVGLLGAAISNVFQAREEAKKHSLFAILTWAMGFGALVDAIIAYAMTGAPVIETRPGYWIGMVYLALFASVLCFSLYYPVVRRIGPGKAAYSSAIVPIIAMALSTLFEGFVWTPLSIGGALFALLGTLLAMQARAGRAKVPNPDAA
ncbi:DMT family transporter [Sphingomicrobium clamense]|uniref:DMT family transporter n=1 Tax=Sphingomicrobium clamense TaxID=2851013 RepID=A0ABS6V3U1_9SPHN|nr:DMT family transporter [Sphingomicrobium sp. B8]MBW0144223.1 DMT family transporter [Sphingomicrobium sp. B8]